MLEPHLRAFQPQLDPSVLSVLGCALPQVVMSTWVSAREAMVLLDDAGAVIFANAYALDALFRADLDAARGCDWMQLFGARDRRVVAGAMARASRGGQARFELFPSGAYCSMAFEIAPVSRRKGPADCRIECFVVTARPGLANTNARPGPNRVTGPCESG